MTNNRPSFILAYSIFIAIFAFHTRAVCQSNLPLAELHQNPAVLHYWYHEQCYLYVVHGYEALEQWQHPFVQTTAGLLLKAHTFKKLGRIDEALPLFMSVAGSEAPFKDYAIYWMAGCYRDLGRWAQVATVCQYFRDCYAGHHLENQVLQMEIEALNRQGLWFLGYQILRELPAKTRKHVFFEYENEYLITGGKPLHAMRNCLESTIRKPDKHEGLVARGQLKEIHRQFPHIRYRLKPDDMYQVATAARLQGDYPEAIRAFKEYCTLTNDASKIYDAYYSEGMCHYRKDDFPNAIAVYTRMLQRFKGTSYEPSILSLLGRCYRKNEDYERGLKHYLAVLNRFPQYSGMSSVYFAVAVNLEELRDFGPAREYYNDFLERYRYSRSRIDIQFQLARSYLQDGLPTMAFPHLKRLADYYHHRRLRRKPYYEESMFWLAKCYEQLKKPVEARDAYVKLLDVYPDSYYRPQVESALRRLIPDLDAGWRVKAENLADRLLFEYSQKWYKEALSTCHELYNFFPFPVFKETVTDLIKARFDEHKPVLGQNLILTSKPLICKKNWFDDTIEIDLNRKGDLLYLWDYPQFALEEWQREFYAGDHSGELQHDIISVALEIRDYKTATKFSRELRKKCPWWYAQLDLPSEIEIFTHPLYFSLVVQREATAQELDPRLVFSVIKAESTFDPDIVSPVGAKGLMQLMPNTARTVAKYLGLSDFKLTDLSRPEVNVKLGTAYLKMMLNEFGDRQALALAAYNAGPHTVKMWKRRLPNEFTDEEFVAAIIYDQTRDYVKKIERYYRVYDRLLKEVETEGLSE